MEYIRIYAKKILIENKPHMFEIHQNRNGELKQVFIDLQSEYGKGNLTEKEFNIDEIRSKHSSTFSSWSQEEDKELEFLFRRGESNKYMSLALNKSEDSIMVRINQLKLKDKYNLDFRS